MIQTKHIVAMLDTAARYAEAAHGERGPSVSVDGVEKDHWRTLERAANLAAHAAEELRDEALRARDDWPVV